MVSLSYKMMISSPILNETRVLPWCSRHTEWNRVHLFRHVDDYLGVTGPLSGTGFTHIKYSNFNSIFILKSES